jgi:glycine/D-amino acid oxidase-like deaminating enzyme
MSGRQRSRRELLAAAGALGATWAIGCGVHTVTPAPPRPGAARRQRRPAPVLVSPERIIRTDVGFRPFRPSGFLVRAELLGDKLVVHNYGHGGAGVTLSWGSAHLALEELAKSGRRGPAAVLGCGAVGLATARMLQSRGFDVTIYARELPPRHDVQRRGGQLVSGLDRRRCLANAGFRCAIREGRPILAPLLPGPRRRSIRRPLARALLPQRCAHRRRLGVQLAA